MPGLGFEGDVITVPKRLARNHMLPVGVAEYVCPQNLKKYDKIRTVKNFSWPISAYNKIKSPTQI